MSESYGIDLSKKVTPLMVRDALINCFFRAHCEDTGVDLDDKSSNREYCKTIITKAFDEVDGNFNDPTKKDVLNVMSKLAEFSKGFRDPEIIKKHAKEMTALVERLD